MYIYITELVEPIYEVPRCLYELWPGPLNYQLYWVPSAALLEIGVNWRSHSCGVASCEALAQSHTWRSPTRDAVLHVTQTYTWRRPTRDAVLIMTHIKYIFTESDAIPRTLTLVCTSSILNTCSDLELTRTRQCKLNYGWLLGGRRASELIHIRCLEWV